MRALEFEIEIRKSAKAKLHTHAWRTHAAWMAMIDGVIASGANVHTERMKQ